MTAQAGTRPAPGGAAADPAKERLRLWLRLLKTSRMLETEVRDRLRARHGTTLPRFDVMAALYRAEGGLTMSGLSGLLRVSNGNVTGIVERLVQDGLVVRAPVEGDRRAMLVRLTRKGRESFAAMAEQHAGWIDELLSDIPGDEAADLARRLNRLAHSLEERTP